MYSFPNYRLLVFCKSPELGKAKTRMQPVFSKTFSLKLHCLLADFFLRQAQDSNTCPIELWLAGQKETFNQELSHWSSLAILEQEGKNLGERMLFAIKETLKKTEGVIVVGTDCPFIDESYLAQASKQLKDHDVVLGPANDGGYVLIGVKKAYQPLFEYIEWGSNKVLAETIKKIKSLQLSYFTLPTLNDIDRPEDVELLKHYPEFNTLFDER